MDPRRNLPAVDRLCREDLVARWGQTRVAAAARTELARARAEAAEGVPTEDELIDRMRTRLEVAVGPMINATGVILHTNLGRAPWSERARAAAASAMGYASVEMDAATGKRGTRGAGVHDRVCALTGAEAGLVVNNCAAAVMMVLAGLATGKKVLVSRDQLVEIGGGFRVPEILEVSGATLVEVGTTNRTHLREYRDAITDDVAAILWVHHSNFKQVGFTDQPTLEQLCALPLPVVADLGSGAVATFGEEPLVTDALAAGVAVACFSGDKLLGGPQAGVLVGRAEHVEPLRRHPLARALRPDKVTLAALEATLDDWLLDRPGPVRAMIEADVDALREVVEGWRRLLPAQVEHSVEDVDGAVGGGSMPGLALPSVALAVQEPSPKALQAALLAGEPRVVGRIHRGRLLLDARTVVPLGQGDALIGALTRALGTLAEDPA